MKLSTEQESLVRDFVESRGLQNDSLKEDIIDHLCCVIESRWSKKKSFDQQLTEAENELAPNGLIELEQITVFLLNANRIIIMKKLMYLIGFIGSLTLTGGVVFKLLHLPGANNLFIVGYLTLFLIFTPLLAFDRYKVAISKALSEQTKIILGALSGIVLGLAGLFKIMHLQGADILLLIGAFAFAFGFLPIFFFTMYKKSIS